MQLDEEHTIQNNESTNIALIWNNLENVSINTLHYVHTVGNTNYGSHQLLHSTFNFRGLKCAVPGFLCLLKKKADNQNTKNVKLVFVLVITLLTDMLFK